MKLILGLGCTGLSIVNFLSKKGIAYKIADSRIKPPLLNDYIKNFPQHLLTLGAWHLDLLLDVDEIFISPGIAKTQSIVVWAEQKNIPVVSDIELFSRYVTANVIGITGSNGKSTVTQLLGNMLASSGVNVAVCGNIGKPVLDCLDPLVDYYVLELSSYQLDYTNKLNLLTGVVLNVTPDHLDRYESFSSYVNAKLKLYKYCQHLVINLDENLITTTKSASYFSIDKPEQINNFNVVIYYDNGYIFKCNNKLFSANKIKLIGRHNIYNVLAALALGEHIGILNQHTFKSIEKFKALEHRLEWLCKKDSIDYYNDSKATNASSTMQAIKAITIKSKNIVLIAGGIAKKEDYSPMFALINKHITAVILIGESAKYFASSLNKTNINYASSMFMAVSLAKSMIKSGIVLLSPACASFDMFKDFNERGSVFKKCVFKL